MPCRSDYDDLPQHREKAAQQERKVDLLTRLLCSACEILDSKDLLTEHTELNSWWTLHSEHDKARITKEHNDALDEYNKQLKKFKVAEAQLQAISEEKSKIERRKR
jgi:hypothetical protein